MFHSWNQAVQNFGLPWAFSKHKPGLILGTTWTTTHLTMLRISSYQMSSFYDLQTMFLAFQG
jgi:hypothetical protein